MTFVHITLGFCQSLFVDKIKLQISKCAFYYKGGIF